MTDYSIKRFHEYSDEELIERLCDFARNTDVAFVSIRSFSESTKISPNTIIRHFGSWGEFCKLSGLAPRYRRGVVSHQDLFANLDHVWRALGRQPRAKEMKKPLSQISDSRYQKEFLKPWYNICLEFLSWKSGVSVAEIESEAQALPLPSIDRSAHKTRREVSLSLRYEVLKRDNFRCVKCGRSPATEVGTQLHIDHAFPWASGGETVLENLQCLCSECNLGKSNRQRG